MSLEACAGIVRRGDPDRFLAAMAAPVAARAVLFPLYAFNVEVARAPWASAEPMIAEMRLQWWRDTLEEIGAGRTVRRHEVLDVLAPLLDADAARLLDAAVEARRWDIHRDPFADTKDFAGHLDATAGHLSWVAARCLGAEAGAEAAVRNLSWAGALANWFRAIPELEARGRKPLPDGRAEAVADLAEDGLRRLKATPPKVARPAVLWCWQARALLEQARREPGRVAEGRLGQSEFARRLGLLRFSVFG